MSVKDDDRTDAAEMVEAFVGLDLATEPDRTAFTLRREDGSLLVLTPDEIDELLGLTPADAERILFGDGHPVRRGLLSPPPEAEPPTESNSRQRRRWLDRHPGRK